MCVTVDRYLYIYTCVLLQVTFLISSREHNTKKCVAERGTDMVQSITRLNVTK